jgi:hypothetical protein
LEYEKVSNALFGATTSPQRDNEGIMMESLKDDGEICESIGGYTAIISGRDFLREPGLTPRSEALAWEETHGIADYMRFERGKNEWMGGEFIY